MKKNTEQSKTLEILNEDVNKIRQQLGKGMNLEEISKTLGMGEEYTKLLFCFGIMN